MGLIACQYRAAEWRHKEIELAAHEPPQHLDGTSAGTEARLQMQRCAVVCGRVVTGAWQRV